ncbi:unnamed protein product [Phytophthora fragariaefolia]|uniref:Unnamed protein product n=1 Tax=Phytophthora fragariaefolia TaxID=1490495 RepID=A0A9W6X8F2_9STRA|nr:unnamed protein product [Phytophthora fragariaefolia]
MDEPKKPKQRVKAERPAKPTATVTVVKPFPLVPTSMLVFLSSLTAAWYLRTMKLSSFNTPAVHTSADKLEESYPIDLPDKYNSELARIDVRHLVSDLVCDEVEYIPTPLFDGNMYPVTEPMDAPKPMDDDRVFFMLNGANDGVYVSWNGQFECVGKAAEVAAVWLGADRDVMVNGVRLYSQVGFPVRNSAELKATKNIVHVLLDFQLWQWPGIKKGYKYVLENGVTLTTVGMNPKVFDVEHYFTQDEADKIIKVGSPLMNRSHVVIHGGSDVVSDVRTSHTAFLPNSLFTREFRVRGARLARLPSPSFVERLQLVRYNVGEFYRQHLDTFDLPSFVPTNSDFELGMEAYKAWANSAADKIRDLSADRDIPKDFREGGALFPNAEDVVLFPNALLNLFLSIANKTNIFSSRDEEPWGEWIADNLAVNARDIMPHFIGTHEKSQYLPLIIKAWEDVLSMPELHYTFPKAPVNDVTHYFAWVRWVKERIEFLGGDAPSVGRPGGFSLITRFLPNEDWYRWISENRVSNDVLVQILQVSPQFVELTIKAWESEVNAPTQLRYKLPKFVKRFYPQRFVTLFLYLNNQTKIGGETVFPHSVDRYSDENIVRDGMGECSTGLAVPPLGLHASLFYVQTPEGDVDLMSRHGGCPPHEGTKWGSNSFMWDADVDETNA